MLVELLRGDFSGKEVAFYLIIMLIALSLSFSVHEFMHALVATWLGDDVAKNQGRVTLNPIAHLDPIGTLCILIAGFGWGKPVQYNPNNLTRFKSKKWMCIMVHLAGVTGNFILALISGIISTILFFVLDQDSPVVIAIMATLSYTELFCLGLLAFNLIPIPPLDGFHVLEELLPYKVKYKDGYRKFTHYGPMVLMGLIMLGSLTGIDFFGIIMGIIELPFDIIIMLVKILISSVFFGEIIPLV
ncbi:MAG: site-2 protease family protein [Clostridiales bacterium]|nr:site-2 protease family protein [Clostridiales bacterium]